MIKFNSTKNRVLIDPSFRTMGEIFRDEDLAKLSEWFDLVWVKDNPIPIETFEREKESLFAVVCCGWRFGSVDEMPILKAILDVGGGLPKPDKLDYDTCFKRRIRVLSCAPAFGPMVAEMALAMALDCTREISLGDRLFRTGGERYLHAGNENTFSLYGRQVGFVGYGGLARNLQPLLEPFRCRIAAYDPWLTENYLSNFGVISRSLEQIMAESDIIFVLAVPKDHPIRKAESAVFSAHRAGSVKEDLRLIGRMVTEDLEAINAGLPPQRMQRAEPELIFRL
jgi:phosphoglycerate dehydrogenase-like enzyme